MVRSTTQETNHSLGDLVAQAARDISQLVRYEIDLAKSEFRMDAKRIGLAAAFGAFCALAGCLIVILLCFALAYLLRQLGAPGGMAGAFALTAAAVALVAIILVVFGRLLLRNLTKMRRTRKTVTEDIAMLRRSSGNGATPGVGDGASPAVDARDVGKLAATPDGGPAPLPGTPAR